MENNTQKEYDLMDLLLAIWNGVVRAVAWCMDCLKVNIQLIAKHKVLMALFLLLGAGWGIVWSAKHDRIIQQTAESQMHIYATDAYHVADQLALLDKLSKCEQYDRLAELLSMTKEEAKQIKGVNAYFVLQSKFDGALSDTDYENAFLKDTTLLRNMSFLTVDVDMVAGTSVNNLASAIEFYLRNCAYLQEFVTLRRNQLLAMREQYQQEHATLDSLRKLEYFDQDRNATKMQLQGGVFVNEKSQQLYHHESISLKESELIVEKELEQINQIATFQHDFYLTRQTFPIIKKTVKCMLYLFILAMFVIWGVELVKRNRPAKK